MRRTQREIGREGETQRHKSVKETVRERMDLEGTEIYRNWKREMEREEEDRVRKREKREAEDRGKRDRREIRI